jgi:hypothetical protein
LGSEQIGHHMQKRGREAASPREQWDFSIVGDVD